MVYIIYGDTTMYWIVITEPIEKQTLVLDSYRLRRQKLRFLHNKHIDHNVKLLIWFVFKFPAIAGPLA